MINPISVSNSISDGGSSIVAQLAAAHQNQHINSSNSYSATNDNTTNYNHQQSQAAKMALASSSAAPAMSVTNVPSTIVMSDSKNLLSNGLITNSNGNFVDNEMLLRDYVNLPPPPPYPGTSSNSSIAVTSSIVHSVPHHGHSTSNVSNGSNGMYKL